MIIICLRWQCCAHCSVHFQSWRICRFMASWQNLPKQSDCSCRFSISYSVEDIETTLLRCFVLVVATGVVILLIVYHVHDMSHLCCCAHLLRQPRCFHVNSRKLWYACCCLYVIHCYQSQSYDEATTTCMIIHTTRMKRNLTEGLMDGWIHYQWFSNYSVIHRYQRRIKTWI